MSGIIKTCHTRALEKVGTGMAVRVPLVSFIQLRASARMGRAAQCPTQGADAVAVAQERQEAVWRLHLKALVLVSL
jgi:hypothetical protein